MNDLSDQNMFGRGKQFNWGLGHGQIDLRWSENFAKFWFFDNSSTNEHILKKYAFQTQGKLGLVATPAL